MDPDREREEYNRSLIPRSFFRFPSFPSLWGEMEDRLGQWMSGERSTGVTVSEDDAKVYIEAQLPGLKNQDIDISLNQNTLWIKGEKKVEREEKEENRKFYRRAMDKFFYQVELPCQVEENSEHAEYQDGILQISFKKAKQNQVRKISIGAGHSNKNQKNGKST